MSTTFISGLFRRPINRTHYLISVVAVKVFGFLILSPGNLSILFAPHVQLLGGGIISGLIMHSNHPVEFLLTKAFSLLCILVLSSRRLRDIGQSQWLLLLFLLPVVNIIFVIYLVFKHGKSQKSQVIGTTTTLPLTK